MPEVEEPAGTLIAAVRADPILARFADDLLRYARPSIQLSVDGDATRSVGESRVGGPPAAHVGFTWPTRRVEMPRPSEAWLDSHTWEERRVPEDGVSPFEFIAQVDLAAVAPFDVEGLLPHDGLLLFFYDEFYTADVDLTGPFTPTSWSLRDGEPSFYQREFGYDEVDQVRVIHIPGAITLTHHRTGPFPPSALPLTPSLVWTLPSIDAYVIAEESDPPDQRDGRVVLPPDARRRLAEVRYAHRANAGITHMLGWEDNGAHGPSLPPRLADWASMPVSDRLRESQDARVLFQLSAAAYEPVGIRFGRTLYFYARESDLRRGDFSRAWYDSD